VSSAFSPRFPARPWGFVLCAFLFPGVVGGCRETGPARPQGPKGAEFDRLVTEWKTLLVEMIELRRAYSGAEPAHQGDLARRYARLVQDGEASLPRLIGAAEAAFLEAPTGRNAPGDFLLQIAGRQVQDQDYEAAFSLTKTLIEHGYTDGHSYGLGAVASFTTNHFDLAGDYFQIAHQNLAIPGLRGDPPEGRFADHWYEDLAYYREVWKKEQALRAAEEKADDLPRVLLRTTQGDIELELFENEAPNTVASFISLVEQEFYHSTRFFRVLDNLWAQGGDPTGTGSGGPGYRIPCECYQENRRLHFRGTVTMAVSERDTGGSQFFLVFVPSRHLDGRCTAFGRVVRGMEVLGRLQRRDPRQAGAPEADKIIEARVLRKRGHPYKPQTLPIPRKRRRKTDSAPLPHARALSLDLVRQGEKWT